MGIIRSEIDDPLKSIDESEIDRLDKELSEIDGDVVRYLKKPAETPVPDFERLIAQIRALPESKEYPKVLSLKITNLKYKAHYYYRSWRQIRENVVEASKGRKVFERRKETYLVRRDHLNYRGISVRGMFPLSV
jgi:succinate dehydrogenase flavin-adding protein (antitoxin of CptAB toxin-antitoxin module)